MTRPRAKRGMIPARGGRAARSSSSSGHQRPIFTVTAGQSNVGNNNTSGLSATAPIGKVYYWHEDGGSFFTGAGTGDANGSTGNAFVDIDVLTETTPDKYCADLGLQRTIMGAGRLTAALRVWQGSTTLFSDWAAPPNSGAKDLFGLLDNEGTQAVADASFPLSNDYDAWLFWVQGEADAASDLHSSNYESRLGDFWTAFKAHAWVTGHNPRAVVLQLNAANARTFTNVVRTAQQNFVTANADAFLLDADDLSLADADHYASADLDTIGQRAANTILGQY